MVTYLASGHPYAIFPHAMPFPHPSDVKLETDLKLESRVPNSITLKYFPAVRSTVRRRTLLM